MALIIDNTMKQLSLIHGSLEAMYRDDEDHIHGDMVILRHYIDDNYINIHFKFSGRKFNLVWDLVTEKDKQSEKPIKRERWSIWTVDQKTKEICKKEYSCRDIKELKFL